MDAASTARIGVPRLEAMQKGEAMMPDGGHRPITVVNVWNEAQAREVILNSKDGSDIIVSHVGKRQHEFS
jgi:hypothetical protein